MSEIVIDVLKQNFQVYKLPERQLVSTYQHNGQVFALWYRDSSFPAYPQLEHQVLFGVLCFSIGKDGQVNVAKEDTLVLDFTDRSAVEERTITSHLFHNGRIIFAFSEKFSDGGKWGNHNYVVAYDTEMARWEIGHSHKANGDVSFMPWSSGMGSRKELSIEYGELALFLQSEQLKVGIDTTFYHLDDWVKNDDFASVAPNAESRCARLKRQRALFVSTALNETNPDLHDYGSAMPLPKTDTKLQAYLSSVGCWVTFENVSAVVLKQFEELYLFDDLCYQAQHIHREEDQKKLPLIKTLSQEDKGVPFTGKLSDLLLSHPAEPVAPPQYQPIPVVRYSDSVSVRHSSGKETAALVLDVLRRTSCILFVPMPDLQGCP